VEGVEQVGEEKGLERSSLPVGSSQKRSMGRKRIIKVMNKGRVSPKRWGKRPRLQREKEVWGGQRSSLMNGGSSPIHLNLENDFEKKEKKQRGKPIE